MRPGLRSQDNMDQEDQDLQQQIENLNQLLRERDKQIAHLQEQSDVVDDADRDAEDAVEDLRQKI